jgi:hypothetical protein
LSGNFSHEGLFTSYNSSITFSGTVDEFAAPNTTLNIYGFCFYGFISIFPGNVAVENLKIIISFRFVYGFGNDKACSFNLTNVIITGRNEGIKHYLE